MQRNAPARGAVGTRSVDVSAGSVREGGGAAGSLIPHAGAVRALVIAMIEAAFGTAPMALAGGADRGLARRRATRRRAIGVAAITRRADRKEAIAASTDFLAKRRVHDVGAAARFDWTRRSNRGTRETTGSVRRSIEAVTEGLEGQAPGPHLVAADLSLRDSAPTPNAKRPWTLTSYGRTERAHRFANLAQNADSHEHPPPSSVSSSPASPSGCSGWERTASTGRLRLARRTPTPDYSSHAWRS